MTQYTKYLLGKGICIVIQAVSGGAILHFYGWWALLAAVVLAVANAIEKRDYS